MTLTLHVLPVGRSLLDRIDDGELDGLRPVLVPGTFAVDTVHQTLFGATDHAKRVVDLDSLIPSAARTRLAKAGKELCAEWTSVAAVRGSRSGISDGEAFVLLATDTDAGLRAAALVAARYASDFRIHYVDDPCDAPLAIIEPGCLYLCRIPGLDLGRQTPPAGTWHSLGAVGHAVAATAAQASHGQWEVVLHLSGGYKAMIPYLLVMAEGINSVFRYPARTVADRKPTLRAIALHESSVGNNVASGPVLVDLPIRALEGDLFDDAVSLKDSVGADGKVLSATSDSLLGLCIELHKGQRRLTPPGMIMVSVL